MALISCPDCGSDVSSEAEACPKCARPISGRQQAPVPTHSPPPPMATLVPQSSGCGFFDIGKNCKSAARLLLVAGVLGIAGWFALRHVYGTKRANRVVRSVVKAPINLIDSTKHVRASSWAAFPMQLPYDGDLSIRLSVTSGNKIDVFVIPAGEWKKIKEDKSWFKGPSFTHFPGFHAKKTRSLRKSGRLGSGTYYLVLRDSTLGILSHSTTDVEVKARLEP